MNNSMLLIKGNNESFSMLVRHAMSVAFPVSTVKGIDSVASAEVEPQVDGAEILILLDPTREEITKARDIVDDRRLPRWAVLACEGPLSPANWNSSLAPHLLDAAWTAQLLRRENATSRGNIRSLGVRIAHDMRTPLGGILAAAENLKEGLAETDPTNVVWVDNIIESVGDLLKLVRHQTTLAEELARPLEVEDFDMGLAVASALEWLEGKLALSKSSVTKAVEWPTVHGDRRKYERVWKLLIENAVRHGGAGRQIELGWEKPGTGYKFWVSNDGPVLSADKQVTLFRPFHRLHEPNSGRGLSLSLMEQLVDAQGGVSGYEVGPSGNPTFYFTVQG